MFPKEFIKKRLYWIILANFGNKNVFSALIFLDYVLFYELRSCNFPRCNEKMEICGDGNGDTGADPLVIALSVVGSIVGVVIMLCIGFGIYCGCCGSNE